MTPAIDDDQAIEVGAGHDMVKRSELTDPMIEQIAARFRLLGEPLRLKLLIAMEEGERSVGELVTLTQASQANVSKHLSALTFAGLLRRRKSGVSVYYAIADTSVFTVCDVICAGVQDQISRQARAMGLVASLSDRP